MTLSKENLTWALCSIVDGMKEHEISEITGLPREDCERLWSVYTQALNMPNQRPLIMAELPPAAQAVLDAALPVYGEEALYTVSREQHAGMIAAAALRAAVEQVIKDAAAFLSPGTAGQIRADFLAIAAELDCASRP